MNGYPTIIPVTDLRRKFGEITENLARTDSIILTKSGSPFAILKAAPEEKKKLILEMAGAWKDTALDNDNLWKEVLKRKSRKKAIAL